MALRSFPIILLLCLSREAIRLQRFPPTRHVMGVVTRTYVRDDLYPILRKIGLWAICLHCMDACSYTVGPEKAMNLNPLLKDIRTTFFSWDGGLKKKKKILLIIIYLRHGLAFKLERKKYASVSTAPYIIKMKLLFTTKWLGWCCN